MAKVSFDQFRAYCKRNGDEPEAVERFITWALRNMPTCKRFLDAAAEEMKEHPRKGSPMRVMADLRETYKIMVINAASPGLARMFNLKVGFDCFQIGRMKTFSERIAA